MTTKNKSAGYAGVMVTEAMMEVAGSAWLDRDEWLRVTANEDNRAWYRANIRAALEAVLSLTPQNSASTGGGYEPFTEGRGAAKVASSPVLAGDDAVTAVLRKARNKMRHADYCPAGLCPPEDCDCVEGRLMAEIDITLAASPKPPEPVLARDWVMVPVVALNWLNGSGVDDQGKWFGECDDCEKHQMFWWRRHFRKIVERLSAAPKPPAPTGFPVVKIPGHVVNHMEWKDGALIVTVGPESAPVTLTDDALREILAEELRLRGYPRTAEHILDVDSEYVGDAYGVAVAGIAAMRRVSQP